MKPLYAALFVAGVALASCTSTAPTNPLAGTSWTAIENIPDLGRVSTQCDFTLTDVMCQRISGVSTTRLGGAYTLTSPTVAVAPTAHLDFTLISDTRMTFDNSSRIVTLSKSTEVQRLTSLNN